MRQPARSAVVLSCMHKRTKHAVTAAALLACVPVAVALADRPPPPRKPPQEAIAACSSKSKGDSCSFTLGDRTINGTCNSPPDGSALACRPNHPPGPPPEAVEACAKAKQGDTCTITHGDHSMAGTCEKGPNGSEPLACRPSGPPPQH